MTYQSTPQNNLFNVQTFNYSGLAFLEQAAPSVALFDKTFRNFNTTPANLGDTIILEKPPRLRPYHSLKPQFQGANQLTLPLTVSEEVSIALAFTNQQYLFNAMDYISRWGMASVKAIAQDIDTNISLNYLNKTYRSYGTPETPVTTLQQLAEVRANLLNFGTSINDNIKFILPAGAYPSLSTNALSQFAMDRNNDVAANYFMGSWTGMEFFQSTNLPVFYAGTVGQEQLTLTITGTDDPTGNNITQLFASGAPSNDPKALVVNDKITFVNSVVGHPDMKFTKYIGQATPTPLVLQNRVTADVLSDGGGNVIIPLAVPIISNSQNANQNSVYNVEVGMQITVLNSRQVGIAYTGNPFFLAIPPLMSTDPYSCSTVWDEQTGLALRTYWGYIPQEAKAGYFNDAIYGSTGDGDYCIEIPYPLST